MTAAASRSIPPPQRPESSRLRVLEELRASSDPLDVAQLAERTRLHTNTVRFHLASLEQARVIERQEEKRTVPGRPRLMYAAIPGAEPRSADRGYRLLAHILASYLAGSAPDPARLALEAGQAWGRYLADRPAPFADVSPEEATRQILALLTELGFDPETHQEDGKTRILLHRCPFREVAESNRDIVCSVHLGLLRGALREMGAPLRATRLEPMVKPSLCIAHLLPNRPEGGPPHEPHRRPGHRAR
jgi:predicted ArsR family transcriptional regulator